METKDGMTLDNSGNKPPTIIEIGKQMDIIRWELKRWENIITAGFPTEKDKNEFYGIISSFPDQLIRTTEVYDALRKALDDQVKFNKGFSGGIWKNRLSSLELAKFAKIIRSLPNIKKGWW